MGVIFPPSFNGMIAPDILVVLLHATITTVNIYVTIISVSMRWHYIPKDMTQQW